MNYNQNYKSNNFVKTILPQLCQINTLSYQRRIYMDPDMSITFGDGGGSEEKRPKVQEVGVGQTKRGAMLSVQSKAIN
jgi:hypothetical protein